MRKPGETGLEAPFEVSPTRIEVTHYLLFFNMWISFFGNFLQAQAPKARQHYGASLVKKDVCGKYRVTFANRPDDRHPEGPGDDHVSRQVGDSGLWAEAQPSVR